MSDPVVLLSTGDVVGPAGGVTDNSMVLFSGTSGKLIKGNNAVVTAAGLALLDDVDAAAQRTTLQLKTGATTDKTVGQNDHIVGRLLKVGDAGILSRQDMRGVYVTGQPQDLYGLGFSVGFADGGPAGLAIPGIASYAYGILEINSHWTEPTGAAGIQRRFTDGTTGAVYTQSMSTATTWGHWVKNGASAAWRLPTNEVIDLNTITEGGWFQGILGQTNANLPTPGYFYLQVMNYDDTPGNCTQVAYEYTNTTTAPRKFTRGNYSGTWTAWSEDWTTSNLVKTTSATDTTAGRVLKVGDFGLGGSAAQIPVADNIDYNPLINGTYATTPATLGTFPGAATYGMVQHVRGGNVNYGGQIFTPESNAPNAKYLRHLNNGIWTPWVEVATSANSLGQGQTWKNVTGSRAKSVTYTNSTGKPILVHVQKNAGQNTLTLTVDGLGVSQFGGYGIEAQAAVTAIVPNGSTYIVGGSGSISSWAELR